MLGGGRRPQYRLRLRLPHRHPGCALRLAGGPHHRQLPVDDSYLRIAGAVGVGTAKPHIMLGENRHSAGDCCITAPLYSVVEREALDEAVKALCDKAIANAPLTTKTSKEAIRRKLYSNPPDIDDLIEQVYSSNDFKNGVEKLQHQDKSRMDGGVK